MTEINDLQLLLQLSDKRPFALFSQDTIVYFDSSYDASLAVDLKQKISHIQQLSINDYN